jgi:hypothetical protein
MSNFGIFTFMSTTNNTGIYDGSRLRRGVNDTCLRNMDVRDITDVSIMKNCAILFKDDVGNVPHVIDSIFNDIEEFNRNKIQ